MKRLALFLALLAILAFTARAERRPLDRILVVVDSDIITYTELLEAMRMTVSRAGRTIDSLPPEEKKRLSEEVMERLITESILTQEARRRGVTVLPAEVEEETRDAMERVRSQFVDQNAYDRALAAEFMTPERLKDQYRHQSECQLLRQKLIDQEVRRRITVTDSDVNLAYLQRGDEIHVRHILVSDSALAVSIRDRLERGEDWDKVAGSIEALEVADLGWVRRGGLVSAFEEVAFTQPAGNHYGLAHTRYGYHVIQTIEKRNTELPPLTDELRETIYNELYSRCYGELMDQYLERLKERAHVEFRENYLALFN